MSYPLTGFEGKVALVTGAGRMRSIGRAVAVHLARAGCDLVVTGSGKPPEAFPDDEKRAGWRDVESVADEVRALGRRALPVACDVRDAGAVQRLAERVIADFGRIDFVINNAGSARGADRVPLLDLDPADWQRVMATNVDGTFVVSRIIGRQMVAAGRGGAIVNVSSIAAARRAPNTGAYATSKAAIETFTTVLGGELGPAGIRVNAVAPGMIDTSRMDDVPRGPVWDDIVRANIPLGRAGTGDDIAQMVVFLCSDQASWITGQTFTVDGGHGHAPAR